MPMHLGGFSLGFDELSGEENGPGMPYYEDEDAVDGEDDLFIGGPPARRAPGRAIARRVQARQLQRQVQALHKQALLQQKAMTSMQPSDQTQVLPFPRGEGGATSVPANTLATVAARPQRPFQTQRFAWPSTTSPFFLINQFSIGQENMFVQAGVVSAEIFAQTGVGVALSGYVAYPGIDITLQVTNIDTVPHPIQGAIVGATLV